MRNTPDIDPQAGSIDVSPQAGPRLFALSVHADFACRHSGACCTAGWPIPVEPEIRGLLKVEVLEPDDDGACGWYDRTFKRCGVHRDHGPEMLPASCYQFPRIALTDQRGTFVTLSHFCPTAANQLFRTDRPLEIVEGPPGFPASRHYDALDGRGVWPPLLRPDALFDLDSYSRWERFVVSTFAVEYRPARAALAQVAAAAERLRAWTVDVGPLSAWIERSLADDPASAASLPRVYRRFGEVDAFTRVAATVPAGLGAPSTPPDLEALLERYVMPVWDGWQSPVCRYLAAKAFGSWSAYQGRGVRTMVAELVVTEMVLRVEAARACGEARRSLDRMLLVAAIRAADRLLVHLADRTALTSWLGNAEGIGNQA